MDANFWGTSKPPAGTALNIDFFLAQAVIDFWPFWESGGAPYDIVRRRFAAPTGTLASLKWTGGKYGRAMSQIATASTYLSAGTYPLGLSNASVWTYALAFQCNAVGSASTLIACSTTGVDDAQIAVGSTLFGATSTNTIGIDCNSTTTAQALANNNSIVQERWYQLICVRRGASVAPEIWLDGSLLGLQHSETVANADTNSARVFMIGPTLAQPLNGAIGYALVANRAWSPDTIRTFHGAPFGTLYAPPVFRRYFIPSVVLPLGWQPEYPDLIADPIRASVPY